jgi:hypothetical protein
VAKWNSYPHLTAAELANADKIPVSDDSQTDASKDATTTITALREAAGGRTDDVTDPAGAAAGNLGVFADASGKTLADGCPPGAGGGSSHYDLLLGFVGQPDTNALDWLLIGRSVTITAADPGEAHARVNPADGDWTAALWRNGSTVGTVTISTAGQVT